MKLYFKTLVIATIAITLAGAANAEDEMLVPGFGAGQDIPGQDRSIKQHSPSRRYLNDLPHSSPHKKGG